MIELPDLKIDRDGDDPDALVTLQQGHENPMWVSLHRCQIQLLAERVGLLPADTGAIAIQERLADEVRVLRGRLELLAKAVVACPTRDHAEFPRAFETLRYMAKAYIGQADPDDHVAAQLVDDGGTADQLPLAPDWRL